MEEEEDGREVEEEILLLVEGLLDRALSGIAADVVVGLLLDDGGK